MAFKSGGWMVIFECKVGDVEGFDVDGGLDFVEIVCDLLLVCVDVSGLCLGKDLSVAATATAIRADDDENFLVFMVFKFYELVNRFMFEVFVVIGFG